MALVMALAGAGACSSPSSDTYEISFPRTTVWEGEVQGRLRGELVTSDMVITLNVFGEPHPTLVEFQESSWEWEGLSGIADGFWYPLEDRLSLSIRGSWCVETLSPGLAHPRLVAHWDGGTTMAGSLTGTTWEGTPADGFPCPGAELVSFGGAVSFAREP